MTDSVADAVQEVLDFYRVYHSMRYVKGDLVLRLKQPVSEALLKRVRVEFADILRGGTFEQTAALPAEHTDPHLSHLPRLVFRFDRHSMGRLRMLIDMINREATQ